MLKYRTGYCYAKSHLLAALLRANDLPAGLCYQRLSIDEQSAPYCLHGVNAVYLPDIGWYCMDARGNSEGINAQFLPPQEQLAFRLRFLEEVDFSAILPEPITLVIHTLENYRTWDSVLKNLPDVSLETAQKLSLFKKRTS